MNTPLTRLSLRLIVPALALAAMIAVGEPLPPRDAGLPPLTLALQQEAEMLRLEAEATKKAARRTASQMRWFLTLPAAGSRRISTPTSAG